MSYLYPDRVIDPFTDGSVTDGSIVVGQPLLDSNRLALLVQ